MVTSLRFTEAEEKKLKEMIKETGLNATTLIKKGLFETRHNNINTNILKSLGAISTEINKNEWTNFSKENPTLEDSFSSIRNEVNNIWQCLSK